MAEAWGYRGDARDIKSLQHAWDRLDDAARIEVLGTLVQDKCTELGVPAPKIVALPSSPRYTPVREIVRYRYDRKEKSITYYYGMIRLRDIRSLDRFDLALETLLSATSEHVSVTTLTNELKGGRKSKGGQPDPYAVGAQWLHEYIENNRDLILRVIHNVTSDRSWYGHTSEEQYRDEARPRQETNDDERDYHGQPGNEQGGNRAEQSREFVGDPAIAKLRDWLRDPNYWIGSHSSRGLHREYMHDIWDAAMRLTGDDPGRALTVATEAVKSAKQSDEDNYEYSSRLAGLPSKVFGADKTFAGVDKLQHFFRSAKIAYETSENSASLAGWIWEVFDWVGALLKLKDTGGFDPGDLWADNLGAAFGAALQKDLDQPISTFLRSPPNADEALAIRLDQNFSEDYIADFIIPSPEGLAAGQQMEVRAVDREGYAYTMHVSINHEGQAIDFERSQRSLYRLSRADPWYFSDRDREGEAEEVKASGIDERTVKPSRDYEELTRRMRSADELRARLLDNLDTLRANQERLERQLQRQQADEDIRRSERQMREVRERMHATEEQLRQNQKLFDNLHQERKRFGDDMLENIGRQNQQQAHELLSSQQRHHERTEQERVHREQRERNDHDAREQVRKAHDVQKNGDRHDPGLPHWTWRWRSDPEGTVRGGGIVDPIVGTPPAHNHNHDQQHHHHQPPHQ